MGIEANPNKIRAITYMQPPQSRTDVQKLIGWIGSLNWFILKLAEHSLPFFTILTGSAKIEWGAEQEKAFESLKSYLKKLPTLSNPEKGQPLILYVSASHAAVSRAPMVEKEIISNGKATIPIVLCFGGPHRIQEILFRNGKYLLCRCYECPRASTLFRGTQNQSPNQPTAERHFWQQRQLSENQQVGNATFRARSRVQKMQHHKVSDFSRFCGRMDFTVEGAVPESAWFVCYDGAWGAAGATAAAILTPPLGITLRYVAQL
jgi:hypothetical protein